MNCQDILRLLNDADTQRLAAAQQAEVAAHLASCTACAEDWRAHEWLRNRSVAPMANGLRQRLWQRLDAGPDRKRVGRGLSGTIVFGGFIVAAAAALLVSTISEQLDPAGSSGLQPPTLSTGVTTSAEGLIRTEPALQPALGPDAAEVPATSLNDISPARVVVLPLRHENGSATAVAMSEAYYSAILEALRSSPELELVLLTEADIAAVDLSAATATGSGRAQLAIADHYDADGVITGTNESGMLFQLLGLPDPFGWRLRVRGEKSGSINDFGLGRRSDDSARFEQDVQRVARGLRNLFAQPEALDALLENTLDSFLDTSRSENDRMAALNEYLMNRMRAGRFGVPLPETAVSALIELGSTGGNPQVRSQAWRVVQRSPQAEFRGPLLQALLYDPNEAVRREAANALAAYPDATAATREILALESNENLLAEQAFRAEWMARDTDARYAYVVETLLDTDLTDAERLLAFDRSLQQGSGADFITRLRSDEQVLTALRDIAVSADDTRIRVIALRELAKSGNPDFMGLFVEYLRADQPLEIRLTAANALWEHYSDSVEAGEALRRIREE